MPAQWISVKVHPGANKDLLLGLAPGRFEAWVRAKPVTGQATAAVVTLLAKGLQLPAHKIRLVKGAVGRHKLFKVDPSA